jgi:predicted transcriptional regulator
MQRDQTVYDDIQFLTGSHQRRNVLHSLCSEPARPSDLCEDIDGTRTTVHRILSGFLEREWVTKRDGEYHATITGREIHRRYETMLDEAERAKEFGPLATTIGPAGDDLPIETIDASDVTISEEGCPLAAVSRFTEWLRGVESELYAVSPIVADPFNNIGAKLLDNGVSIQFVIDETVLEQSRQNYESELELGIKHSKMDLYVHERPLSIGVAFDRTRCCLLAYDERTIKAVVTGADGELYEWIQETYERYRDRSVPIASLSKDTAVEGG